MPPEALDAVVVGAGPNGLAAAIRLAQAGRSVLVLEANRRPGGGLRTEELLEPGFRHDVCSTVMAMVPLSPALKGIPFDLVTPPAPLAHPFDDGTAAVVEGSLEETARSLGRDGPAYRRLLRPLVKRADDLVADAMGPLKRPRHPLLLGRLGMPGLLPAGALARVLFRERDARALLAGAAAHSIFKVDWTLEGPIPWRAPACARAATVHLGGTLEEIARSEHEVAGGRTAERPFVIMVQPTLFDPSRAPAGKHVAWAYCHLPNGCDQDLTKAIEDQVERFAPGFGDVVRQRRRWTPAQLQAAQPNCVGGDIGGGRMDLGQLFTRPVARLDPYRTSDPAIFICSAATPPAGGIHGLCGWYAARSALRSVLGEYLPPTSG